MSKVDVHQVLRFGVVGVGVAALYVLLYLALKPVMAQPLANGLAFLIAVVAQYLGQTLFTFRKPLAVPDQIGRFIAMIAAGLAFSALITGWAGPAIGLVDWLAAAVVTIWLPVQNYIFMKLWVYTDREAAA